MRYSHWALPAGIVGLFGLVLLLSVPCSRDPSYLGVAAGTSLLATIAWSNHVGLAPIRSAAAFRALLIACVRDLFLMLLWIGLGILPVLISMPAYQCYTDRAKAAEIVVSAGSSRTAIEQNLLRTGTLVGSGSGVRVQQGGRIKFGLVTSDGVIIAGSDDPAFVVTLTPSIVQGTVTWVCRGYPAQHAPLSCRGPEIQ